MNDKIIMDCTLTIIKNACDLMVHGSIESKNDKVSKVFLKSVDEYLKLQNKVFKCMEKNGLYEIENVDCKKVEEMFSKHYACLDD